MLESPGERPGSKRDEPRRAGAQPVDVRAVLELLAVFAAPASLVGALAFQIGTVRFETQMLYFGLEPSIVGLSYQDYVLRSLDALIRFAVGLAVVAVVLVGVHVIATALWRRQPVRRQQILAGIVALSGGAMVLVGTRGLLQPSGLQGLYLLFPVALSVGALLVGYGGAGLLRGHQPTSPAGMHRLRQLGGIALGLLVLLGVFWAANDYARVQGLDQAVQLERQQSVLLPRVIVSSPRPLHLSAGSAQEEIVELPDGDRLYRYAGLRLFIRSGGHYFLISENWSPADGVVVMLPEDSVRLEFVPRWTAP